VQAKPRRRKMKRRLFSRKKPKRKLKQLLQLNQFSPRKLPNLQSRK
jgi:hypothetical protein